MKTNYQKIRKTKLIILIYFFIAGFFLFSSCKQNQKVNQTTSGTRIESTQEDQSTTEIKDDSSRKMTFRSEHPVLFTIITISILVTTIVVALIIKSAASDFSNISNKVSRAIDFVNILSKLGNK